MINGLPINPEAVLYAVLIGVLGIGSLLAMFIHFVVREVQASRHTGEWYKKEFEKSMSKLRTDGRESPHD